MSVTNLETKTITLMRYCEIEKTVISKQIRSDLLLGDCLEILPTLPDKSINTICTDPPFFVPAQQYVSRDQDRWGKHFSDLSVMRGFFDQISKEFRRLLKPDGHVLVFCDPVSYPVFFQSFYNHFDITRCLIWYKGKHYFSLGRGAWRYSFEMILHSTFSASYYLQLDRQDMMECPVVPSAERLHPAQKPVKLLKELIKACTPENGIVLDPFCGSGSTLLAAKELGFGHIGIEMDSVNYENAKRRLNSVVTLDEKMLTTEVPIS